jgi:hypothetical protein
VDQRSLRNSSFNVLRSSSVAGVFISSNFEEYLISGRGHLPFEVSFNSSNFQFWFGPLCLSLKFKEDQNL